MLLITMMIVVLLMTIMFNVHAVLDQFSPHTLTKCRTVFRRNKNYDYDHIFYSSFGAPLQCQIPVELADYIVKPSLSLSDHYSHKTGPQLNSLGPGNTIDILSQVASHPRGIKLFQYNLQFTAPKISTKVSSATKNNDKSTNKGKNVLFHSLNGFLIL